MNSFQITLKTFAGLAREYWFIAALDARHVAEDCVTFWQVINSEEARLLYAMIGVAIGYAMVQSIKAGQVTRAWYEAEAQEDVEAAAEAVKEEAIAQVHAIKDQLSVTVPLCIAFVRDIGQSLLTRISFLYQQITYGQIFQATRQINLHPSPHAPRD